MGYYHNRLNKKYFYRSIYIKKFEETFNIKIKDYPLQYDIIIDTYNTIIDFNNILFSKNYIPAPIKVDNAIALISAYIGKYKSKYKKCFDSSCVANYEMLELDLEDLVDRKNLYKTKNIKYNLKSFESTYEEYIQVLDTINFDKLVDSKDMPYIRELNEKLPNKVNLKLIDNLDYHSSTIYDIKKQDELNNQFIEDYYNKTGIDLKTDTIQKKFIFDIHNWVKDINNSIVDYYIYNNKTTLKIYTNELLKYLKQDITNIKDIQYTNLFAKLKDISSDIINDDIDIAYNKISSIISQYSHLYERNS